MAKLANFRVDTRAINDGAWIRVGPEYDDLEILSRGFTDDFLDAQEARLQKAAQAYNGDQAKIPNGERRSINASLLEDFLILDIRNMVDELGKVVEIKDFHSMLYEPDYSMLSRACWLSAGRVTNTSAEKLKSQLGNSVASSRSISPGAGSAVA